MKRPLDAVVRHADELLRTAEVADYSGARNGLQVANDGTVTRILAAVDANLPTLRAAVEAGADLLVVHHGLFWSDLVPVTGANRTKLKLCLDHNLAVYSSHLPLDLHPVLGNNVLLARALGLRGGKPFFESHGNLIGLRFRLNVAREALVESLATAVGGRVTLIPAGSARVRHLGIVTGGAGGDLARAAAEGVDTFITGEGPHWTFGTAHDLGLNVLYGGHYATETFGVKALAAHLSKRFRLPWSFHDAPSGL